MQAIVGSFTSRRKVDHICINLEEDVQFPRLTKGLERYRFEHQAIAEINLEDIDTSLNLFGRSLRLPILISALPSSHLRRWMKKLNFLALSCRLQCNARQRVLLKSLHRRR